MSGDAAYFVRREKEERLRADQSADERVRHVHLMLADKYAELAKRDTDVEADFPDASAST